MNKPQYLFALRQDLQDNPEFLPTRAHETDTGWDVRAAMADRKPLVIKPFDYAKIDLGFRAFCPQGFWFELKPRSSTFAKKSLHALYGTIDESFEGSLVLAAQYIPDTDFSHYIQKTLTINFGDAIGQIIPVKRQEMEAVSITNEQYDALVKERGAKRGEGGFGSSDSKGSAK